MASGTRATVELRRLGVACTVHEFQAIPGGDSYGLEAARALGVEPARVHKTLLAEVEHVGVVVAMVPVDATLDLKALAAVAGGKRAAMLEPRIAERRTGYVVGGISPIGQRQSHRAFLDASARDWPTIFVSGGRRGLELELAPADLQRATGASLADLARRAEARVRTSGSSVAVWRDRHADPPGRGSRRTRAVSSGSDPAPPRRR